MRIHCPMNPEYAKRLDEFVSLGADEFYLGYASVLADSPAILNLRHSSHSNFTSREDAAQTIARIRDMGKTTFITVNGPFYPESHLNAIVEDMAFLHKHGADGFIISDINVFLRAERDIPGLYLIASSGAHVLSARAVEFYASLGARRCILPRQLTISEITRLVTAHPDMDFEIFMKNEACAFLDGYCAFSHYGEFDYRPACNELFGENTPLCGGRTEMWTCGTCALYHLKEREPLSLKICGRALRYDPIYKDIMYLRKVIDEAPRNSGFEKYQAFCRKTHESIYGKPCGQLCYYNLEGGLPERNP